MRVARDGTAAVYRRRIDGAHFCGVPRERATMAFAGLDYYAIDEQFTTEERLVRDTVRELVSTRILPTIGKHWSAGTFPHELATAFGELGLLGPSLTGYGCPGVSA